MFVIAHNKIFYRRCALFLPSFPVHTIKFILSENEQVDKTDSTSGESAASSIAPLPTAAEDFDDYPRNVKENVLRNMITDSGTADNLGNMRDEELVDLFVRLKAA
jgi:hypothetical protein